MEQKDFNQESEDGWIEVGSKKQQQKQKQIEVSDNQNDENQNQCKKCQKGNCQFHDLRNKIDPDTFQKWNNEQQFIRTLIKETDDLDFDLENSSKPLKYIGGVDISFCNKFEGLDLAVSYLVIMEYPSMKIVYKDYELVELNMEYVPGFLAFREAAHLVKLYKKLIQKQPQFKPQVIMVDGNGILHSNACGLASHLGVLLNLPTIGVGKTSFYVDGLKKFTILEDFKKNTQKGGDHILLIGDSKRVWGAALKSNDNSSDPIYVSIGTKISIETSVKLVNLCCKYRIPEPIRQADLLSREITRKIQIGDLDRVVKDNKLEFLSTK